MPTRWVRDAHWWDTTIRGRNMEEAWSRVGVESVGHKESNLDRMN